MINLQVIRRHPIFWGLLPRALAVATYYGLLFTLAVYLQRGLGCSALVSGIALLPGLLALGGLGLGTTFSSILVHVTAAATPRYAAEISGTFTTSVQIAGTLAVAAFGSLYLSLLTHPGGGWASHAFGVVTEGGGRARRADRRPDGAPRHPPDTQASDFRPWCGTAAAPWLGP